MIKPITKRITTSATTTVISTSCLLLQAIISCPNAGTTWTLAIQDKAGTPNIWIPAFTLSIPSDGYPNVIALGTDKFALPMQGGIDIVTAGTPGVVSVCLIINDGT